MRNADCGLRNEFGNSSKRRDRRLTPESHRRRVGVCRDIMTLQRLRSGRNDQFRMLYAMISRNLRYLIRIWGADMKPIARAWQIRSVIDRFFRCNPLVFSHLMVYF
jgi:hypothetical protein